MAPEIFLPQLLFVFGLGFFIANVKVTTDLLRFFRRRSSALLIWQNPKPRFYGFALALGAILGLLVVIKIFVFGRTPQELFGEVMMFLYFGYAVPLSTRIERGFYRDGIWSDSGFMPWGQIQAVSWREGEESPTLMLVSHFKNIAKRLEVPGHLYGEARRVLRDKVKTQDIHMGRTGLDLGSRSDEDTV
jgi:hypothetical protein